MHRKVQVVVVRSKINENLVLLMQTNKKRGEFWQNITGSVEKDEEFEQGALRELEEETGLIPSKIEKLEIKFKFKDQWDREVLEHCYLAMVEKEIVKIDSKEHQDYQWLPTEEVKKTNYKFLSNWQAFEEAKSYL